EDARDLLAAQPHGRARLAQEAVDRVLVAEHRAAHELQGDTLIELGMTRRYDDPHPAGADHPLDTVLSRQHVAGLDAHHPAHHGKSRVPMKEPGARAV